VPKELVQNPQALGITVLLAHRPASVQPKKPPVYFKAGDSLSCTYQGIGTLVNPVIGVATGNR
jgi:hypothetical protein